MGIRRQLKLPFLVVAADEVLKSNRPEENSVSSEVTIRLALNAHVFKKFNSQNFRAI